ncbi:MAG: hypothetical protein D6828_00965, partial [Nitrospirae bacterium]
MMRYLKLSFLILLILIFTLSCEKVEKIVNKEKKPTKTVAVLIDLSGSTKNFRKDAFRTFKKILSSIDHGDVIVVAKITESSISEPEIPIEEAFPEFVPRDNAGNPTDNPFLVKKAKKEADKELAEKKKRILKKLEGFLFSVNAVRTDIMSSLHVASRIFSNYPRDKAILVIISDMIENSGAYNFDRMRLTEKRIEEIINTEKAKNRMPELYGVKVYVVCGGNVTTRKYFNVQQFWMRYFKECGAELSEKNYGSTL